MSKMMTVLTVANRRFEKTRRTIAHSPDFGDDRTADEDSPSGRIPPGGFLTG
ncbi:hypothetical protein ACFQGT_13390 [Natrialbaceae archaeon GCM10025810]|uniref:hypothetical protein n=1 Tax=Halovalidus salilacus TaxID=3075124 RepID=UPI0036231D8D